MSSAPPRIGPIGAGRYRTSVSSFPRLDTNIGVAADDKEHLCAYAVSSVRSESMPTKNQFHYMEQEPPHAIAQD